MKTEPINECPECGSYCSASFDDDDTPTCPICCRISQAWSVSALFPCGSWQVPSCCLQYAPLAYHSHSLTDHAHEQVPHEA